MGPLKHNIYLLISNSTTPFTIDACILKVASEINHKIVLRISTYNRICDKGNNKFAKTAKKYTSCNKKCVSNNKISMVKLGDSNSIDQI